MVKRISQLIMLGLGIFLLSGCQKELGIEEAASLYVEGEFYLRAALDKAEFSEKYGAAFGERITDATLWETETRTAVALAKNNVPQTVRKAIGPALSTALLEETSFTVKKVDEQMVNVTVTGLDLKDFDRKLTTALEKELEAEIQQAGFKQVKTLEDLTRLDSSQDLKAIEELIADFQADTAKQQTILVATIPEFKAKSTPQVVKMKLVPQENQTGQWKVEDQEELLAALTKALLN